MMARGRDPVHFLIVRLARAMIVLLVPLPSPAQVGDPGSETFARELLQQDFDVFRNALEEAHPGIHTFVPKEELDSMFNTSRSSIPENMTSRQFTVLLCKLVARIRDGHLRVVPPKRQLDPLDEGAYLLPVQVHWDNGDLYVWKNYSSLPDTGLLGARIVSINGRSTHDLLRDLFELMPSDGNNMTHKYRMLPRSRQLVRYLYMLNGYPTIFRLEYIARSASVPVVVDLAPISFDTLLRVFKERYGELDERKSLEFTPLDSGRVGYLRVSSFDKSLHKDQKLDFGKFLRTTFTRLSKDSVQHLILDLRDNGGGTDEYGKLLYSYFTGSDFQYYRSLRMNKESFDFFRYTSRPDIRAPKGMLKANGEGTFDNIQHPNVGIQKHALPTYTGRIYVLINGGCFSTTSEFLSMLHDHTNAVFVGEESGGGYYGNCSGPTPDLILPNTMVRVEIPLMQYRMNVEGSPRPDRGIIPDEPVRVSIDAKLGDHDVELERALELIDAARQDH
ncbi:MAG: S41 family peptidase [Flavobacteriales bacterium]